MIVAFLGYNPPENGCAVARLTINGQATFLPATFEALGILGYGGNPTPGEWETLATAYIERLRLAGQVPHALPILNSNNCDGLPTRVDRDA